MPFEPAKQALTGGRTTPGVVRVGDTVRRPPNANSAFVRSLLRHLEGVGFAAAPRALGADEQGREVFSYLPGEVPSELGWYADEALRAAARLIRRYHDATAGLPMLGRSEVVCHNDLSPCNCVFRAGRPIALIDFDAAAPGRRAFDLGYATWLWLDLGTPQADGPEQRRRLALFLKAYGADGPAPDRLIEAMLTRQRLLSAEGRARGDEGLARWAEHCARWTRRHLSFAG